MDEERVKSLIEKLTNYPHQIKTMQLANYSLSAVRTFKKYYNALHLELIEYVKFKEDKYLAEIIKQLKGSKAIFKSTDKWIGLLSLSIVFPGILLIYMYTIQVTNLLMATTTAIVAIIVFILIRKVQTQPNNLFNILNSNEKICNKIIHYLQTTK